MELSYLRHDVYSIQHSEAKGLIGVSRNSKPPIKSNTDSTKHNPPTPLRLYPVERFFDRIKGTLCQVSFNNRTS